MLRVDSFSFYASVFCREKALHATSDAGLVEAVEWIAANQKEDNNRELPKDSTEAVKTASGSETVDEQTEADSSNVMKSQAASYVCDVYVLKIYNYFDHTVRSIFSLHKRADLLRSSPLPICLGSRL